MARGLTYRGGVVNRSFSTGQAHVTARPEFKAGKGPVLA